MPESGTKSTAYIGNIGRSIQISRRSKHRTIGQPVHMVETMNKVIATIKGMIQETGKEPSPKEIAKKMKMTEKQIRDILKIIEEPVSLDKPIGNKNGEDTGTIMDMVAYEGKDQEDLVSANNMRQMLYKSIKDLSIREEKILRLKYSM